MVKAQVIMIRLIDEATTLILIDEAGTRVETILSDVQVLSLARECVDYLWANVEFSHEPPSR